MENFSKTPQRIAKIIARSGYCSRRDAEKLIAEGRVAIDGKVIESAALNVLDEKIYIDGKLIKPLKNTKLFLYHKPVGLITTNKDEKGRRTIFDDLPNWLPRVITVGRLDLNSEGLLLLTNDGELARELELPANEFERIYKVRVFGKLPDFGILRGGIEIDGVRYGKIEIEIEKQGKNSWLIVKLREGKNREIRRVMAHLGLEVNRLIRLSYGEYELGELKVGEVREVQL